MTLALKNLYVFLVAYFKSEELEKALRSGLSKSLPHYLGSVNPKKDNKFVVYLSESVKTIDGKVFC